MQKDNHGYFENIALAVKSTFAGLKLTWQHLVKAHKNNTQTSILSPNYFAQKDGIMTLQYPHQHFEVPDNGRYKLHNEMDDCIVCDKCAKVCPVDCIDIEPIKSSELIGHASDGSPIRLYAAKFDIDMAKCCFCGLCTTVCPTECLTMTGEYDFSEFDIKDFNFKFGNLTEAQADQKKRDYETFVAEKEALKAEKAIAPDEVAATTMPASKPVFRPKMPVIKSIEPIVENTASSITKETEKTIAKPVFKPRPIIQKTEPIVEDITPLNIEAIKPIIENTTEFQKPNRPVFKPKPMAQKTIEIKVENTIEEKAVEEVKPNRPVFKPKPLVQKNIEIKIENTTEEKAVEEVKPNRPVFKPRPMPPKKTDLEQ